MDLKLPCIFKTLHLFAYQNYRLVYLQYYGRSQAKANADFLCYLRNSTFHQVLHLRLTHKVQHQKEPDINFLALIYSFYLCCILTFLFF